MCVKFCDAMEVALSSLLDSVVGYHGRCHHNLMGDGIAVTARQIKPQTDVCVFASTPPLKSAALRQWPSNRI